MNRCCLALFCIHLLLASALCSAGELQTVDGKTYSGQVRIKSDRLSVVSPGSPEFSANLAQVRRVIFDAPAAAHALPVGDDIVVHGLKAEYFPDQTLKQPKLTRLDSAIDFEWGGAPPDPAITPHFAARWTGQLVPRYSEAYSFNTITGDGCRLWIDNKLVIDQWKPRRGENGSQAIVLEADHKYDLRMEFFNEKGDPVARLFWSSQRQPREIIPPSALLPPAGDLLAQGPGTPDNAPNGNGLRGEYFPNKEMKDKELQAIRIDPAIDFEWTAPPLPNLVLDHFAVRWNGRLQVPFTDMYTISVPADDGVRLWIDGRHLIDSWHYEQKDRTVQVHLETGKHHDIRLEYYQEHNRAFVKLLWECSRMPKQTIPTQWLFPPGAGTPIVRLKDPSTAGLIAPHVPVSLEASIADVSGTGGIKKVEFFSDSDVIGTCTAKPYAVKWQDPAEGIHQLSARVTLGQGPPVFSSAISVEVAAARATLQTLTQKPVGQPKIIPTTFADGQYTISAETGELYTEWDSFNYQCVALHRDGQIVAHIAGIKSDQAGAFIIAGLMIRGDLTNRARHVSIMLDSDKDTVFLRRTSRASVLYNQSPTGDGTWLRLVRQGATITASQSSDGVKWRPVGSESVVLPDQVFVGLAMAGKGPGCQAVFDHVEVTEGKPATFNPTAGVQTVDGSFVPGEITSVFDGGAVLKRADKHTQTVPLVSAAKLLFKPVSAELFAVIQPGQTGVLLNNGDFMQGTFNGFQNGRISIDSVLFGPQKIDPVDALAVVLRDTEPSACLSVTLADGSVLAAASWKINDGKLELQTAAGPVSLGAADIREMSVAGP